MKNRFAAVMLGCAALVAAGYGYGGFEVTASYVSVKDLNRLFTELNSECSGTGEFKGRTPLVWYGGHGGSIAGPVSLGGRGALTARDDAADSLEAQMAGAMAGFEVGYPYGPRDWFWVRPCVELGGGAWVHYVHSRGAFSDPSFKRWFLAWTTGITPAIEVMGRVRYGGESFAGVFLKAGWYLPFGGPRWTGDDDPPAFSIEGFSLQFGLRFGRYPYRPIEI
jgi:hypothetical protein